MKMKAVPFFETSGNTNQETRRHMPEHPNPVAVIYICFGLFTVYNKSLFCCFMLFMSVSLSRSIYNVQVRF
jgi:cytochrome c biogenesis protein ResB